MKNLDEILKAVGSTADWYFAGVTDVNQKNLLGDTPLHVVCGWGDAEAAQTLIKAGADVNARGEYGRTPLFEAVSSASVDIVKMLLDAGADPLLKAEGYNCEEAPLFFARIGEKKPESEELIKLLETATMEAERKKHNRA